MGRNRRKLKPCPPVAPVLAKLTLAQIEAAKSPRGGWTRETLHGWGIPWPPAEGWKDRLTGGEVAPPRETLTTIFADAAYNHRDRIGGWGCWLIREGSGLFFSGELRDCPTSVEAELRALANGLHLALVHGVAKTGGTVMLQSDCTPALSIILGRVHGARHSRGKSGDNVEVIGAVRNPGKSVRESLGMKRIALLCQTHDLTILVRHVRGHQSTDDGRSAINRQVDRLAKRAADQYRKSLGETA